MNVRTRPPIFAALLVAMAVAIVTGQREQFANNCATNLAAGINNSVTSLSVTAGHGARCPSITAPDYFFVTLEEGANREVVKVTARSTDTFTIVRAQQGTAASAFTTAATVQQRVTKGTLDNFVQGAGRGPIFELVLGSDISTGANTTLVDLTGMAFTAEAGATYTVRLYTSVAPAAATTGHGYGVNCAQTPQIVSMGGYTVLANTGTSTAWQAIANNAIVGVTSGTPSATPTITANNGFGIIKAHATIAGTCTFRFRSEVAAVTTTKAGGVIVVTRIA